MKKLEIKDVVDIKNDRVKEYSGVLPYLTTGGLNGKGIEEIVYVDFISKPSRADLKVDVGDIIFARMKSTNKVLLINENSKQYIVSTGYLVLKSKSNVINKFLFHFLKSKYFQRRKDKLCVGATQQAINNSAFNKIEMPLPPLSEQKRIAEILDKADSIRQKRKESIALLDEFLRSVFLDMFGDPVRNEKGWKKIKLGEVVEEFKYGTNEKSYDVNLPDSIPVIRIPNVLYGKINYRDLKYSVLDDKEKNSTKLLKDDLLFVRTNGNPNYIGRCAVFKDNKDCSYASYLIRTRFKKESNILPDFVQFYLSQPNGRYKLLKEAKTTAGNFNISTEGLRRIQIINPPLNLQTQFAKIVEQVEVTKAMMEESLREMDNQFEGLLQRVFK